MGVGPNLTGYQSKRQKASEARGSALALMIVGLVILALTLLWAFNLIPGNMSMGRRFIMCGVLGVMSIIMLIASAFSMKSSKTLLKGAKAEDKRTEEILKWARENLTTEGLDDGMIKEDSDFEEEEKCILRMQRISYLLDLKFMNLEPAYIDEMSERIYLMLYENAEEETEEMAS
jgi:Na+/melibiose symporter-like transporter